MSVRDKPVDQIIGQMKTLSGLSCDVKDHLESLKSVVESCPPDAPGAGGAADVESEMKHYVEAHSRADASNLELNRAMQVLRELSWATIELRNLAYFEITTSNKT